MCVNLISNNRAPDYLSFCHLSPHQPHFVKGIGAYSMHGMVAIKGVIHVMRSLKKMNVQ